MRRTYYEKVVALEYVKKALAYVLKKAECNEDTAYMPNPNEYDWFINSLCSIRNCLDYCFNSKEESEPKRTMQRIIDTYKALELAVNVQGSINGFYADENAGYLRYEYNKLRWSLEKLRARIVPGSSWN